MATTSWSNALVALALTAGLLGAQTTAPAPPAVPTPNDALGRTTPQNSVFQFLEACHANDYDRAVHYLDLRRLSPAERASRGPQLARQLEDLLDNTPFSIATLSRSAEGDLYDGLTNEREWLYTFRAEGKDLKFQLDRVELKPGFFVWLVSADSVALIPEAHELISETPFEKKLPQFLVTTDVLSTPIWRWIALLLIAAALWFSLGLLVKLLRGNLLPFRLAVRFAITAAGLRIALEYVFVSAVMRLFIQRALGLILVLAITTAAAEVIDLFAQRYSARLDPKAQAVRYSVLPLLRKVSKLTLYMIAVLSVVSAWGYNTSTVLAGLGVGGLAVALAAQKTIENLFGGVSVIGDRPVLVGDVCRFGTQVGTVMRIGLRSTQLRTADRTVISVPNAQFSTMSLENISTRDKIFFHPTLNLRRSTTADQLAQVLSAVNKILTGNPEVETGAIPVRFIGVGPYSLDVEINAYVTTADFDKFLKIQQDLLIEILRAVEQAGSALAVPLQENLNVALGNSGGVGLP